LIDNALDACENAGVAPEIAVDVQYEQGVIRLTVSDNGTGIPAEVVRKVIDYNVRVSDKAAYRSPTRGAQGNALKRLV
jgi:DNA topoisomerase VI subunit B